MGTKSDAKAPPGGVLGPYPRRCPACPVPRCLGHTAPRRYAGPARRLDRARGLHVHQFADRPARVRQRHRGCCVGTEHHPARPPRRRHRVADPASPYSCPPKCERASNRLTARGHTCGVASDRAEDPAVCRRLLSAVCGDRPVCRGYGRRRVRMFGPMLVSSAGSKPLPLGLPRRSPATQLIFSVRQTLDWKAVRADQSGQLADGGVTVTMTP